MKIILSRKGFDSEAGKVPSPIFPDGRLCSLPIPSADVRRLGQIRWYGKPLSTIVADLTGNRLSRSTRVHLDPDLRRNAVSRRRGWRPAFGQVNAAQSHLIEQGVGEGDLFLFFGWFRQTVWAGERLIYRPGSPNLHVLFGWLQIGQVVQLTDRDARIPAWAAQHPHVQRRWSMGANNTLYIGSDRLWLPRTRASLPGAGVFSRVEDGLILTRPNQTQRSSWRLPRWLLPVRGRTPLTYHERRDRWIRKLDHCILRSVARGQEFVFDTDEYPEAVAWLRDIFDHARRADGR